MGFQAILRHGAPGSRFTQNAFRLVLSMAVLLLAAYLRITGLTWGINNGYGHGLSFQPDEFLSLRGVEDVDLLRGQLRAPAAYWEGTFNYYLWAIPKAALELFSGKRSLDFSSTDASTLSHLIYICRWMTVLFDLAAVVIIFLAIREVAGNFYAALFGALVYAVLPMEVIYAHYMRPHVLSNLLCGLVFWLSLKVGKSQKWWLFLILGIISGLAAATRFPMGVIVAIPCLFVMFAPGESSNFGVRGLWRAVRYLLSGPVWLIALGFGCGLFVGHPMLFLDTRTVIAAVSSDTLKSVPRNEFALTRLLDLSAPWKYLSYLIPYGMYPLLWIMPYCAIIYLAFRRSLHRIAFPILIFSLLYVYPMAQAYVGPYWARAAMPLFPGFCILVGVALNDLWLLSKNHRAAVLCLVTTPLLLTFPSVVFDTAYARAMQQKDARQVLREDLQKLIGGARTTIGISRFGAYFYTVMPAAEPLSSEKVAVQLQDPAQDADFFLVGFSKQVDPPQMNAVVRKIELQGKFKYEKTYGVFVKIFRHQLSLARFPQDMTYPFPTILLFRAKTPR